MNESILYGLLFYSLPAFIIGGFVGFVFILLIPKEFRGVLRSNVHRIAIGLIVTGVWLFSNYYSLKEGTSVSWWLNLFMGVVVMFCFTTNTFKATDIIDKFTKK